MPGGVIWWALRKLDAEKWLFEILESMDRNAGIYIRVNGTFSNGFLVQVGLHQDSVISHLLFTIVLEALSREIRLGFTEELLYADGLASVKYLRF